MDRTRVVIKRSGRGGLGQAYQGAGVRSAAPTPRFGEKVRPPGPPPVASGGPFKRRRTPLPA